MWNVKLEILTLNDGIKNVKITDISNATKNSQMRDTFFPLLVRAYNMTPDARRRKRNSIFHLRNLRGRKGSSRNKKHARKLFFPEKDKNNDASTLHTFFRRMALAFDCAWWLVHFLTARRGADWTVWSLYVGAMSLFSLNAETRRKYRQPTRKNIFYQR